MFNDTYLKLGIDKTAFDAITALEASLAPEFAQIELIESANAAKVLSAFIENHIAARHFAPSTGYGYGDDGRDGLDRVFASAFQTESAVVSPHLVSGTHAIFCVLSGLLLPGDTMLAVSGQPYDTLVDAIGINFAMPGSLREQNIDYQQIDLFEDGGFDYDAIVETVERLEPKLVYVQRSRGYAWRDAILPERMAEVFSAIKRISPRTFIVVDNCYGEFVREFEPTHYGADLIVGSLIKNPGGGLAPTGGYFAGSRAAVERVSSRLTVPGIGREVGAYFGSYLPFYQGLFYAPHTVAQSLKTGVLFSRLFEQLGLETMPSSSAIRSDIVQSLRFDSKEKLIEFCRCIQSVSPIDGFVMPEPYPMPGYNSDVIMASGAFVQGSSIELSADAPIVEPYTAYLQGGLTYSHGRLAAMKVLTMLNDKGAGERC